MDDQKQQLVQRLREAQNVLVTVSKNPSVDQLSAAIGLTLALNKLDKHATAVYSGKTPSTIEFLRPEDTLETNTDSLRDFIIALDKSKADKLRYKVEDEVVRIFITPYHTAISEEDLEYSQGDFNVDVVVALGVHEQQDLDEAIQSHGRILHDATVAALSIDGQPDLGAINVTDTGASSLAEIAAVIVEQLSGEVFDEQIATAFLTGIVSMTDRFGNDRTTPQTMNVGSKLMAAGANQQLVAAELAAAAQKAAPSQNVSSDVPAEQFSAESTAPEEAEAKDPGTLEIHHEPGDWHEDHERHEAAADNAEDMSQETEPQHITDGDPADPEAENLARELPEIQEMTADIDPGIDQAQRDDEVAQQELQAAADQEGEEPQIQLRPSGDLLPDAEEASPHPVQTSWTEPAEAEETQKDEESFFAHERVIEPPSRSGTLTANTVPEGQGAPVESLTRPTNETPILSHHNDASSVPATQEQTVQPPIAPVSQPETPPQMKPDVEASPAPPATPPAAAQMPEPPVQAVAETPDTVIDTATQTLSQIEQAVDSPHVTSGGAAPVVDAEATNLDDARNAVDSALRAAQASTGAPLEPVIALNAQPLGDPLHQNLSGSASSTESVTPPVELDLPGASSDGVTLPSVPESIQAQVHTDATAPPSAFPGSHPMLAGQQASDQPTPPPVPPPPVFPTA